MFKNASCALTSFAKSVDYYLGGVVSELFPYFDEAQEPQSVLLPQRKSKQDSNDRQHSNFMADDSYRRL